MKLVFMGTPEFAVPSLKLLDENHEVVGVITAPDKPSGRGKKVTKSAVKISAEKLGLNVVQPTNLKDGNFLEDLRLLTADLFVVLAFRMLPELVWTMPPKGTINLHASLLPNYRGAAPINRAIMNGENKSGLTTFFIEKEIDKGSIIEQVEMNIGVDENCGSLHDRMMDRGAQLLLNTVNNIETGTINPLPQKDHGDLHPAPKIFKEDCKIDWRQTNREVHNHIRGLSPYPAAWTVASGFDYPNQSFKVLESKISELEMEGKYGNVVLADGRMFVKCGDGAIEVCQLQASGKKRMKTSDYLRGFKPPDGFRFE